MKNKLFTLMLILSSSLFLINCSKGSSNSTNTTVATAGTCSAGYVYIGQQYGGCVPQNTCPTNYGYYNGSCYPATTNTTTSTCGASGYVNIGQYGCVPQGTCPVTMVTTTVNVILQRRVLR